MGVVIIANNFNNLTFFINMGPGRTLPKAYFAVGSKALKFSTGPFFCRIHNGKE
jgi:hypothetical protein